MNQTQLSAELGIPRHQIGKYQSAGMPVVQRGGKGKEWIYDLEDVTEWLREFKAEEEAQALIKAEAKDIESELDDEVKRRRIQKLDKDIELAEMKIAMQSGKLVPIEDVAGIYEAQLTTLRTQLRTIPSKLAPRLEKLSTAAEIKESLQAAIDDALTELALPKKYKNVKPTRPKK